MPYFESPSLYIDFTRLPPPKVIEEIDYETLVAIYRDQVVARNPRLERATRLEQSPTNIVLEAQAYGEMLTRARVNAAARAVMLAFATGSDLDNLAAFYNVFRATIPEDTSVSPSIPAHPEDDERFRRRVQLAPEAFSTAGSVGSYIWHGLDADPTIRDISVTKINDRGGIKVTVMNSGSDPAPTQAQLEAVTAKLFSRNIKPLTDVVSVAPAVIRRVDVIADLTLYPGPDVGLVLSDVNKALDRLRGRIALIGRDLTRSALIAALNQEGVQNVALVSPQADIVAASDQCAWIQSATINVVGSRME